jgi:hypothetical protein
MRVRRPTLTGMTADRYVPFPAFAEWSSPPVDMAVVDGYAAMLDRRRAEAGPAALDRAVRAATRLAAIDTGAIDGLYEVDRHFTMTVGLGAAACEAAIDAREPVVRRSFEDALRAYDFVLDLATGRSEISAKAIREIHAIICAGQDTHQVWTPAGWQEQALPRGEYQGQLAPGRAAGHIPHRDLGLHQRAAGLGRRSGRPAGRRAGRAGQVMQSSLPSGSVMVIQKWGPSLPRWW